MFELESTVDSKYVVKGLCSDAGGMGTVLFVAPIGQANRIFVLKYCKLAGDDILARFKREVRVMQQLAGNSFVMPIVDANLDHNPPYFVMPYFEYGDMGRIAHLIRQDIPAQEQYLNRMIDCVDILHQRGILHRDIKPQNFLVGQNSLVVSDLGLCTEIGSVTGFTNTTSAWGTDGYRPPEYWEGGFKNADVAGDVFMLGKTFYVIISGRTPSYMTASDIPPAIFAILERCCATDKSSRYQSLTALRQSLTLAYDMLLNRSIGFGAVYDSLERLAQMLDGSVHPDFSEINRFIERLIPMEEHMQIQICQQLRTEIFSLLAQNFAHSMLLDQFLVIYEKMAASSKYDWHFAEVIADNMKKLFDSAYLPDATKANGLMIAIVAAHRQNRFAAMDTCTEMITSIVDPGLGQRVHDIMLSCGFDFLGRIEQSNCRSPATRAAVAAIKAQSEARWAASI